MIPKDQRLDRKEDSEEPLENQPLEWSEEDREMEDRSPDLGEIEEDTSDCEGSACRAAAGSPAKRLSRTE